MKRLEDLKKIADTNLDKLDMSEEAKQRLINEVKKPRKSGFKKLGIVSIPAVAALIAFVLFTTGVFPPKTALKVQAMDLMKGVTPNKVETVYLTDKFKQSTADFSIDLFKKSYTKGKNSLVSPASVYLALGMTANGTGGNTLKEFEAVLGKGMNMKELNAYYSTLMGKFMNSEIDKVNIANSIWYRNDNNLKIKGEFLQTNADYYKASAYKADFNSKQTVEDINNWVKANTGGQIDKIVDNIKERTVMYLINAVNFDAQWEKPYEKESVRKDNFELQDGSKKSADLMYSKEYGYIKDDNAQGFMKRYKDGKYSFVALLPNEGVSIDSYVASLSGSKFISLLNDKTKEEVVTALPMFKSEYSIELVEPLKQLGLKECFNSGKADFSKMVNGTENNPYVSEVLHKTFISVDTKGTKAGAATKVTTQAASAPMKSIILNRPFVYAIVDNETNLPLFIGTMMNPTE
jgi:serine protease inhibitor